MDPPHGGSVVRTATTASNKPRGVCVHFLFFIFLAPDVAKEVNLDPTLSSSRWRGPCSSFTFVRKRDSMHMSARTQNTNLVGCLQQAPISVSPLWSSSRNISMPGKGPRQPHGTVGLKPTKVPSSYSGCTQYTSYPTPLELRIETVFFIPVFFIPTDITPANSPNVPWRTQSYIALWPPNMKPFCVKLVSGWRIGCSSNFTLNIKKKRGVFYPFHSM